ncbi:MAG: hypothetical protein WCC18_04100 [Candidatus Acidiferrales bacterium]
MPEFSPQVLATMLHDDLVTGRSCDYLVETLRIPEPLIEVFRYKVALYRAAVILMRLIAESSEESKFVDVQTAYETILFGPAPTPEGLEQLTALKAAMADLHEIVRTQENPQYFSWARKWFADIGYDATNPITNFLLVNTWMEEYVETAKAIKKCLAVLP